VRHAGRAIDAHEKHEMQVIVARDLPGDNEKQIQIEILTDTELCEVTITVAVPSKA
jgi:HSP20 family molecular chaperone IbpA